MIERSIIFSESEMILPKDLNIPKEEFDLTTHLDEDGIILTMEQIEKIHIKKALDHNEWNRENTARALDISQKTLYSKIIKYNLK
jgi:transcriptional regulator with PAS, ATPase and Fis domain